MYVSLALMFKKPRKMYSAIMLIKKKLWRINELKTICLELFVYL